jgi:hypothetical protein
MNPQWLNTKIDAHVKSLFYMDLGIQVLRPQRNTKNKGISRGKNCKLLQLLKPKAATPNSEVFDFQRTYQS